MKVCNTRAVITGGGNGIGWAIARSLLDKGCQVLIADSDTQALDACTAQREVDTRHLVTVQCDVTDSESVRALADRAWLEWGGVDLVFANAGVGLPLQPFLAQTEGHARWAMEVNYFGVWHTLQTFGPRLIKQNTPCHVVVTGSENSVAVPAPLLAAYNASKHAVLGLTETFARETPECIGVSLLCPALVATNIAASVSKIPEAFGGPETYNAAATSMGFSPEYVAECALAGVEADDFYIFTHHCNASMIRERLELQLGAIDRQTKASDGSDACNTRPLLGRLFDRLSPSKV